MSTTTVAELAETLGLPPSAVLDQCQRLGIDAPWAGAELAQPDVARIQAELATAGTDAASGAAGLPPTAVGRRPDLIDEVTVTDDAAGSGSESAADDHPSQAGIGFAGAAGGGGRPNAADAPASVPKRHLDRGTRHGIAWLVASIAIFAISTTAESPWMVWGMWVAGAVALGFTILDANRGRRQASLHPERISGLALSVLVLVGAAALVVALAASLVAVVRPDPAADVPVVGELDSVATARWGFHRVALVSGHGWSAPAKVAGTCWRPREQGDGEPRKEERVEVGDIRVACNRLHTVQVLSVFSLERDVDAPYPGLDGFVAASTERCAEDIAAIDRAGTGSLLVEYPTETGWADADHDVTCAVRYAEPRSGPLETSGS